ncbi:glycerol kinase [Synechocystis sp. PCC 6803]|uniref:Glycerol kinase n=1 Tax=Synechocystis sp. (strain ATCC 27184 / PCC 6803 / Kazusa) TaxID=1111708 RepID=GLPK_SYNY3|nr:MULTISPECIES: glycerol kinase GlpK [unclassified Synechocystis]P74260.1 RecName: Full=Glycerol kinase; AltName: Full=ATP:glycerol 3-phosphotransferase; AltName: Full=Glycerokinase; Short=GK [Synechocystis sp. PCC 6803 substr. Kazusa]BAM54929.1 glycerol kinase [Synechocystis sp. PCC 6803] [Bacillus subtilis BEST7613]AGF52042.1 glycerol kinase [Synechocystis sp. PCC 6803]ALJ68003.1 glycerol kinase [Synechocystis sp. PCC 6803]AVP89833.1 glycerol kinase [Synechocystis sp. IPPAS B-1465]QWO79222
MTAKHNQYVMALDLGTTGNRAILFDYEGNIVGQAYKELTQFYPKAGWVEHDALEIWRDTKTVMQEVVQKTAIQPQQIVAIGLTVQRETCLLWDKTTGQPLHPAIVWQDRRTAHFCGELTAAGYVDEIYERTGLVLDAYFSGTKLHWLLDWVKQSKSVDPANLLAGTIDSWALWNLTGGKVHRTDHSNASRTMVLNLDSLIWDEKLLDLFTIPAQIMPEVQPSLSYFGVTDPEILGVEIPITAIFGDQQAALYAHGCDRPGLLKCTYGTGAFLVANTGQTVTRSQHRLLSTVAWTQTNRDKSLTRDYALEGSMFTAGSCVQWLRDKLGLIESAAASESLARSVDSNGGVYFVPALSGLGAPHWDMNACGAFLGLTAGVTKAHLVRSVLEAIAFQAREVVEAINQDSPAPIQQLKVDGGACNNDFLMQCQADVLGIPVERPAVLDATAQGAAFGAGLKIGWNQLQIRFFRTFHHGTISLICLQFLPMRIQEGVSVDQ